MISIAIIGILSVISFPLYQSFLKKVKAAEAAGILDSIITAEIANYAEYNVFTTDLATLGNPDSPGVYYTYSITITHTPAIYTAFALAKPSTKGKTAGLEGSWTLMYDVVSGEKTATLPHKGY